MIWLLLYLGFSGAFLLWWSASPRPEVGDELDLVDEQNHWASWDKRVSRKHT